MLVSKMTSEILSSKEIKSLMNKKKKNLQYVDRVTNRTQIDDDSVI